MSTKNETSDRAKLPAEPSHLSAEQIQELCHIDQQLIALMLKRIAASRSGEKLADSLMHNAQSIELALANQTADPTLEADLKSWLLHGSNICATQNASKQSVVYLGPIYSYSYLAAVKYFGLGADLHPVTTIAAAFDEVVRKQSAYGIVPIENSTDGRIVDTLGMFARSPVEICGEVLLPIHHCLLGACTRSEVREVHSKPQALSQCRNWLAEHLPEAKLIEVSSTAVAAATAAKQKGVAAIASREAGIHHGCIVIDANIEDNTHNVTRFAVIGNRVSHPNGNDKTSIMFQLRHEPGALASAMVVFQKLEINLTWIESFPLLDHPNEYLFFVELDGHQTTPHVARALEQLRAITKRLDVLGSYPRGIIEA